MHHMQFFIIFFLPGERSISALAVAGFPLALIITVATSFSPSMSSRRSRVEAVNDFSLKDGEFSALRREWGGKNDRRARKTFRQVNKSTSQTIRSRADELSDRQVAVPFSLGQVSDIKAGFLFCTRKIQC